VKTILVEFLLVYEKALGLVLRLDIKSLPTIEYGKSFLSLNLGPIGILPNI